MNACKVCGEMNCYAHGGDVRERPSSSEGQKGWVHEKDYTKGVHREIGGGESYAGSTARKGLSDRSKELHQDKLKESRSLPKPKLEGLAKGGEVEDMDMKDPDHDGDSELHDMVAEELMGALERKDKKGILEAIKAIAMSCGGKI